MSSSVVITSKMLADHGLSETEYQHILQFLGREPLITELGMFSVMWSEHCSYKTSKHLLKKLSFSNKSVLIGAGEENAGVVDIGDGLGIVFKVESHNHPSAVEPYEGAATGVGGIIRDIFTMGARPIACMNSLRFGSLETERVRFLLERVVAGIADYGNCMGIPTVGGELVFDSSYEANPLVNVFCLGLLRHQDIVRGAASGQGNCVLYVGSSTGRDGIHGATFASDDLTDESEEKKSAVQVGDPFMEKLLLEACLEVIQKKLLVGIQDMGAGGLTCSICETASRGNSGIDIDVSLVPLREKGMTPYEIMLSESQERMLLIVEPSRVAEVQSIFSRWDLNAVVIGSVTDGDRVRVHCEGECVVDVPVEALTSGVPSQNKVPRKPDNLEKKKESATSVSYGEIDWNRALFLIMSSPNISNKAWVYEQFDHMVGTNTVLCPGSDSAVLRLKETETHLAMTMGGNGAYCFANPYEGAKIAVAEASRNIVCSGARPIAASDCLNFGNPMNEEVFWTFDQCISGIKEACSVLGVPIIGGNVSFYNQNPQGAIFPTPIIAVVGLLKKAQNFDLTPITQGFKKEGDLIVLLGDTHDEMGASEFFRSILGKKEGGVCPTVDLEKEKTLYQSIWEASEQRLVQSLHDCSEGGLAVALAESCLSEKKLFGATVTLKGESSPEVLLFSESQSRVVLSCRPIHLEKIRDIFQKHGVTSSVIGSVCLEKRLTINDWIDVDLLELKTASTFCPDRVNAPQ